MLIAFSVLRCLTYFFLWLGPPKSILPSRPPTEALGSFFLTCGGLVFMFSTEEVTIAAMRRGRDGMFLFVYLGNRAQVYCRRDDVPQRRCGDYVSGVLLDSGRRWLQGLAQIQNPQCCDLSQCLKLYICLFSFLLPHFIPVHLSGYRILHLLFTTIDLPTHMQFPPQ